ncbi:hypothetical protein KY285_021302 [Solanum tuberosum]|nr:hypothetical protein KY285_021302 [Solanum tuberosum]
MTNTTDAPIELTMTNTTDAPIDSSSPLYMHPSDNPGAMLVPNPFNGTGYRSWRRGVLRSLSVKNKLGFINGECEKPASNSPNFRLWERCDDMVTSWILNSLGKEIADSVEYVNDAAELWRELEDRYDQTNGAKLYQIQKEINDLSQGILDITGYYTKMKKLWEELSSLNVKTQCSCACTCGAKESVHKGEQDRRLIQFLMGLNEVYTAVRGSILMMNPLPSLPQAFSLLVQDERQREIRPGNQLGTASTSLSASVSRSGGYNANNGNASRQSYDASGSNGGNGFRTNYSSQTGQSSNKHRVICEFCKKPGHTKEKCYKLHGYPQNNQNYQNQNFRNNNNNNSDWKGKKVAHAQGPSADMLSTRGDDMREEKEQLSISKDQYAHLVSLLQHFHPTNTGESSDNNIANGSVNFAGPFNEEASGDW